MTTSANGAGIVSLMLLAAIAAPRVQSQSADQATDSTRTIQAQMGTSNLAAVLTRSCGDCHSYTTTATGWYTRVPPFSTLLARGASEGRKAVNFAEWRHYTPEQQRDLLLASCADARRGTMPARSYVRLRREAQLSPRDIETICAAAAATETKETNANHNP
jgi:hypothetical protein